MYNHGSHQGDLIVLRLYYLIVRFNLNGILKYIKI